MKKKEFKSLCTSYGAVPEAVEEYLVKDGLTRKEAIPLDVLDAMFVYCTDLFYCRSIGDSGVEYLDNKLVVALVKDASALREII